MLKNLSWPAALVLSVGFVCLASTALFGKHLGLDGETLRFVLGGEGALGMAIAALMRPLLNK